jgi:NAD(P)-dependent dehydrogenase (short-subunit alcohol dehydrogenase family)
MSADTATTHSCRDLEGHTAFITGSGRNIGRAIALEFASRGANVIVNSRTNQREANAVASECRARGVETGVVIGEAGDQATIDAARNIADDRFGGIDISVSNAALRPFQVFTDISFEDWQGILDVQLNASYRLAATFVPGMIERGWGRIIHITGPDAFLGIPNRAHNVASKGALRALTKALAVELGPHGITVNDVAPGILATDRLDLSHPHPTPEGAPQDENDRTHLIPLIPVGRLGKAEDVAYACGFLASPRASYYSGTVMCCFGGWINPA